MPDLARQDHEKDQRHDSDHANPEGGAAEKGGDSPVKLQADGKAADAAIKRMSNGDHSVGGGEGGKAMAAPSAGDGTPTSSRA
ncbi:MAG: hypothetical protein EXR72_07185 [Myxococcales bacterium]|nr:hypothetical protein [Myxococcales bacterium]